MFHPQQSPGLSVASWELSAWLQVGTMMKQQYVEHVFKACTIKRLWLTTYTTQGCTWSSSPGRGMWAACWDMLCGRLWILTWSRTRRQCCIFRRSRSARSLSQTWISNLHIRKAWVKLKINNMQTHFWQYFFCTWARLNSWFTDKTEMPQSGKTVTDLNNHWNICWTGKITGAGTWKHQILCGEMKRP